MSTKDKTAWRYFPLAVILSLLAVILVNAGFVWTAIASFPGAVDDHAFDTGNSYNHVLDVAAREAALGWTIKVEAAGRTLGVTLVGADGRTPAGLELRAVAAHPVGPAESTRLDFAPSGDGFAATASLPGAGQWDVALTATAAGATYHATRRVIVK